MKKWKINKPDDKLAGEMKLKCDLSLFVLKLMTARGFCDFQQIVDFFNTDDLADPFLIADMQQAADIINEYIDDYRLICVYGDYDCDGITATALLFSYLQNMGANVIYHINERDAGYGMNLDAVHELHEKGVELIVTVDNGISCLLEAEEIAKLGMKLVITDHHQPPEILPKAEAVVNPHRRDCPSLFKDLAGVGVALKLCVALDGGDYDAVVEQYADICSIGTVGDVVPVVGENRTIIRKGLMYLNNTENFGLNALMNQADINRDKLNSSTLAFQICPKINAAGRIDSPLIALKSLLTENQDEAESYVEQLMSMNNQRKQIENDILLEIQKYINNNPQILNQRVLILSGKNWHHGVIGIVASRVLEAYGKPNIILSIGDDGIARGSARSLHGFSIHSCLTYASEYLDKFGGHECAGGLSIKERYIPQFTQKVLQFANEKRQMPAALTECDMAIAPEEITVENIRSLEVLQPFGEGNPAPLFYMPNCRINAVYPMQNGKHTKIYLTYGSKNIQAPIFSKLPQDLFFEAGSAVDIAANIGINTYNGKESLELRIHDIIPHGMDTDKYMAAKDCYEKFMNGAVFPQNFLRRMTPSRKELVWTYKLIAKHKEITVDNLFMVINHPAINYCKLRIMIEAFCEAGIAEFVPAAQLVRIVPAKAKADLQDTNIMKRLNSMICQQ